MAMVRTPVRTPPILARAPRRAPSGIAVAGRSRRACEDDRMTARLARLRRPSAVAAVAAGGAGSVAVAVAVAVASLIAWLAVPAAVLAHGPVPAEPPTVAS